MRLCLKRKDVEHNAETTIKKLIHNYFLFV
jgi:hypothetical protein